MVAEPERKPRKCEAFVKYRHGDSKPGSGAGDAALPGQESLWDGDCE